MLDPARYLLGCAELLLLIGFAWLGAARVRSRLVPTLRGAAAHLATAVLAIALLLWTAELLGTTSLFKPAPYVILVAALGLSLRFGLSEGPEEEAPVSRPPGPSPVPTLIALVIAAIALLHFAVGVKSRLMTGMTGFDSTWYHGTFAAGFYQSGNTIDLHFIAPQFLAWFYPANSELLHAVGMLAFGRDLLSPLLNLGWLLGCLVACWSLGRPYGVAPWSLALGAIALSVPALSDQAGEARNDLVGIFFLLAAVAVALNARRASSRGVLALVGLAAGLAAGTKLNFLLPAAVLVLGLVLAAPPGRRLRAFLTAGLAALAGGGYWYLRNLVQSGNPLPWIHHLGPLTLPAPEQALGGREAHSVFGYLTDGTVWSDWFLPGLHHALWIVWPLLGAAALTGLALPLFSLLTNRHGRAAAGEGRGRADAALAVAGLVGLASSLAWLLAPTSASGPEGMPRGFESGLRYLAPALVLGLALLPAAPVLRERLGRLASAGPGWRAIGPFGTDSATKDPIARSRRAVLASIAAVALVAVAVGYPVERHYLRDRYAKPEFTSQGMDAAFKWASGVSGARIATTATRQYPLFGTDLSNRVQYVGIERPHGGFEAATGCRQWRRLLDEGRYDYVVASRDRIEPGQPAYPPEARWTEGPQAEVVLRRPPTVVFRLKGPLPPSACP
ncbi:MAG TPA: hypothetical protein VF731_04540 [Solirubrobacterales bacterium]